MEGRMKGSVAIVRRQDLSSEQEARDLRARAWRFIFDCHAKKAAARSPQSQTRKEDPDQPLKK